MYAHDIIKKPLMSEKTYQDIQNKKYWFVVDFKATKTDIKLAVEEIFKVKVAKVNTAIIPGKPITSGKQKSRQTTTSQYKKAAVTLTKDSKSIEFFDSLA